MHILTLDHKFCLPKFAVLISLMVIMNHQKTCLCQQESDMFIFSNDEYPLTYDKSDSSSNDGARQPL